MNVDRVGAVIRDVVTWVFGLTGIGWQLVTGNVNVPLLTVFAAMTGVPGVVQLISLARGPATGSPSSRVPLPQAESPSGDVSS